MPNINEININIDEPLFAPTDNVAREINKGKIENAFGIMLYLFSGV